MTAGIFGFTRAEVLEICEALGRAKPTPKQLHYWAETKLIGVTMVNQKLPIYDRRAIRRIVIFLDLLKAGLSSSAARLALDWVDLAHQSPKASYTHPIRGMTDGAIVRDLEADELLVELLNGKIAWKGFEIDLAAIDREIDAAINAKGWQERVRP